MLTLVVECFGINYTGKYNLIHNDHVNKYHSVNTKNKTEEKENKNIHLNLSPSLNVTEST